MAHTLCSAVLALVTIARCSTEVSDFISTTTDVYGCHGSSVNMKWTYTGSDDVGVYVFYYEDTAAYMMHKKPGQEAVSHGQYVDRVAFMGNESMDEIGIQLFGVRPSDNGNYSLTLAGNGDKNADAKLTVLTGQSVKVNVSNGTVYADEPFGVHVNYTSSPVVNADVSLMQDVRKQCASPCAFSAVTLPAGEHWLEANVTYPGDGCTLSGIANLTVISGPTSNTGLTARVVVITLVVVAVLVVVITIYGRRRRTRRRKRKGKQCNIKSETTNKVATL